MAPEQRQESPRQDGQLEPERILRRPRRGPLWWRGTLPDPALPRVAVIGSRKPTPQQAELARVLGRELAAAGAVVVSGGALGVDAAALWGALDGGGRAVAVLPSAVDEPFPAGNRALFDAIVAGAGGLLSAQPPGTQVRNGQFLGRNLLIVRMVDALVTVCAGVSSGSLHCAGQAWMAGLPVLAVPWSPASANSAGGNGLLRAGARAITDAADCAPLVDDLRHGRSGRLLSRDPRPPGHKGGTPLDCAARSPQGRENDPRVIDAAAGRWPSYPPVAVTSRADASGLAGCDADLATRLVSALREAGPPGLPLEELALHLQADRGPVAALAMRLTLLGCIRRHPGGSFAV